MATIGRVISAGCQKTGLPFVVNVRTVGDGWEAYGARAVGSAVVSSAGSDRIDALPTLAATYPGCPHCQAASFFGCFECTSISCWDGVSVSVKCAGCGVVADLGPVRPFGVSTTPWQ